MNILGVGGWELVAILLIMLMVAGPERMIRWAYQLGRYAAYFRRMWAETMKVLQEGLNDAGIDVELPKEIPTRGSINREINKAVQNISNPLNEPLKEIDSSLKLVSSAANPKTASTSAPSAPDTDEPSAEGLGTWSGDKLPPDSQNGASSTSSDYGTWSVSTRRGEK